MTETLIKLPHIGGESADVIETNVVPGDSVTCEDTVITLESDKATMEIPASVQGVVVELLVKVGDSLKEGDNLMKLKTEAEPSQDSPADQVVAAQSVVEQPEPAPPVADNLAAGPVLESRCVDVCVPDIGMESAAVVEVAITVGDEIEEDDTLLTLESDKATMDIPATATGTVTAVHVQSGTHISEGQLICQLQVAQSTTQSASGRDTTKAVAPALAATELAAVPTPVPTSQSPAVASERSQGGSESVYAGPAVRKLAREFGIDLLQVAASGPKGRLLKEDLHTFVKNRLSGATAAAGGSAGSTIAPIPEVDFSQWGTVESEPLSRLQQVAAKNFQRSWLNIPHVTQHDQADITELERFRKAQKKIAEAKGTRLTPLPFILKAIAYAMLEMPQFCASLSADGTQRILKKYVHIGIAVDTPHGLLVPVIRDVNRKGLWELAAECAHKAELARNKQLKPDDMRGGCFTISSLGSIGGTAFTPIVNSPEVAILGVSKAQTSPLWNGKEFEPRLMLPLSLSYDHRAINGAEAAKFTVLVATLLADIRGLLL